MLLCKRIGGGSSVELGVEEEEGTVPTMMGRRTDAGRAARGEVVAGVEELVARLAKVDGPPELEPGSVFTVVAPLDSVSNPGTLGGAVVGRGNGVDVSGGGNGPLPLFTLRFNGGSKGTPFFFFPSLPPVLAGV